MTAPQQPEPGKHCGHECVCMSFSYNKLQKFARPCVIDTCQHDTRQRNVPEGERMYAITGTMLAQWRVGCINPFSRDEHKCHGCPFDGKGAQKGCCDFDDDTMQKIFQSRPLSDMCMERNWAQGQPQDAAAGKAAVLNELRTNVLKRIDEQSACAKKGHVGSRETDLINAAYREIIGDIDYALRTTPASGINPTESDGRGYRCLHCEIRNGSLFCHYHDVRIVSLQEHDEQVKREAREEVLNEICVINKGDGCCNGQPHGKDCFDCAFIHLRSEVKKP